MNPPQGLQRCIKTSLASETKVPCHSSPQLPTFQEIGSFPFQKPLSLSLSENVKKQLRKATGDRI